MCDDAFGHSGFNVSGMRNVTISAVNCLGQRATYKVSQDFIMTNKICNILIH